MVSVLMGILYWGCRAAAFPLLVLYFAYRVVRDRRYLPGFSERLGAAPSSLEPTPPGSIWLHAVSVGEVISAAGLLREVRERNPNIPLFVSVGTVAGRAIAQERLSGLVDGIFYLPIDYAFAVRRVLARIRPALVVILETEIWPMLYREVRRAACALIILNGRISDRAFPHYRSWRVLFRRVLGVTDAIFVQSEKDRERYIEIGAPPQKVETLGNLKYDAPAGVAEPPRLVTELIAKLKPATVWIAASTMPPADRDDVDEDEVVLRAFRELAATHPGLLLILVPRKPERFEEAAERFRAAGVPFTRRSQNAIDSGLTLPCVLLLDSIGELASVFPLADVVFLGGTLARRGGHNVLEPALSRRAIVIGPHMENFAAIAEEFRRHGALLEIGRPEELAGAVERLAGDVELREKLGARAAEAASRRRGATRKAVAEILRWHDLAVPMWSVITPARVLLQPLAGIWTFVSQWALTRKAARARRLATPVVSIGGISMGGAGKTPMVNHLAERLRELGHHPAILTRGYRRRSIESSIVIKAGKPAPVSFTGDEAQIFVQSGFADAGIGADRWVTGRLVEERYGPDIFLLDDGFQHRKLARDLDVVLIDALDPFAGGAVFPLGMLREPPSALARAGAFVIVRAQAEREYQGLRGLLRAINPGAPVFRARMDPRHWINRRTGLAEHPPEGAAAAFCGLANPGGFWGTLRALNLRPVFRWTFPDHHRYTPIELHRLAAQARMHGSNFLLTTEKDSMNLPGRVSEVLAGAGVELYWLKVGLQVEDEGELLALIESKLRKPLPDGRGSVTSSESKPGKS